MADPKTERAVGSVLRQVIAERAATLTGWAEHLDASLDVETGQLSSSTLDLTAAEAETLIGELMALARRYSAMARDREALAETRRYRVYLDVLPLSFDK